MGIFSRKKTNETAKTENAAPARESLLSGDTLRHEVWVHFAQPMNLKRRYEHEDGIVLRLMPDLGLVCRRLGGGTALDNNEPVSADIELEIESADMDSFHRAMDALVQVFGRAGIARGSWLSVRSPEVDEYRIPVGVTEVVLLRTRRAQELKWKTQRALIRALGESGTTIDDAFHGHDGTVYSFGGPSAEETLKVLRAEIPRYPQLKDAELVSISPGAAEGPPPLSEDTPEGSDV